MNKYKLAIFDMDGTILNTFEDLKESLNYALSKENLPNRSLKEIYRFVGNGLKVLVEKGVPENTNQELTDKVYDYFINYYLDHCNVKTAPYPGIVEVIKTLKQNGYKTAVVSNKIDSGVQQLCEIHFKDLFDASYGVKDGVEKKPSPDMVLAILKDLDIDRKDAVFIGDSEVDFQTGINANLDVISVLWGCRDKEELKKTGAYCFVDTPEELLNKLL